MCRCEDVDVKMICVDVKMMCGCVDDTCRHTDDVCIYEDEDDMKRYEDVKMYSRPPLHETPFAQTLVGKRTTPDNCGNVR